MLLFSNHDFIDILKNCLPFTTHVLFGMRFDLSEISGKALVLEILFLSLKRITQAYIQLQSYQSKLHYYH